MDIIPLFRNRSWRQWLCCLFNSGRLAPLGLLYVVWIGCLSLALATPGQAGNCFGRQRFAVGDSVVLRDENMPAGDAFIVSKAQEASGTVSVYHPIGKSSGGQLSFVVPEIVHDRLVNVKIETLGVNTKVLAVDTRIVVRYGLWQPPNGQPPRPFGYTVGYAGIIGQAYSYYIPPQGGEEGVLIAWLSRPIHPYVLCSEQQEPIPPGPDKARPGALYRVHGGNLSGSVAVFSEGGGLVSLQPIAGNRFATIRLGNFLPSNTGLSAVIFRPGVRNAQTKVIPLGRTPTLGPPPPPTPPPPNPTPDPDPECDLEPQTPLQNPWPLETGSVSFSVKKTPPGGVAGINARVTVTREGSEPIVRDFNRTNGLVPSSEFGLDRSQLINASVNIQLTEKEPSGACEPVNLATTLISQAANGKNHPSEEWDGPTCTCTKCPNKAKGEGLQQDETKAGRTPTGNASNHKPATGPLRDTSMLRSEAAAGEPIHIPTGSLLFKEVDTSYRSGHTHFLMLRSYDSARSGVAGWFGRGWRSRFERSIRRLGDLWVETSHSGAEFYFKPGPAGTYLPNEVTGATFVQELSGEYVIRYPNGTVHRYANTGLLKSTTDAEGHRFSLEYGNHPVPNAIIDPSGRRIEILTTKDLPFNQGPNVTGALVSRLRLPNGDTWRYHYQQESDSIVVGGAVDFTERSLRFVCGPHGRSIEYTYDASKRLTSRRELRSLEGGPGCGQPLDSSHAWVRTWTYDSTGRVASFVAENGQSTRFSHIPGARRMTMVRPDGGVATYTYDEFGQVTEEVASDVGPKSYEYSRGEIAVATQVLGAEVRTLADQTIGAAAQALTIGVPHLAETRYEHDPANGRVVRAIKEDGRTQVYQRNRFGKPTRVEDEAGGVTRYIYDASDRFLVSEFDPTNAETRHEYDVHGNRTRTIDAEGGETQFEYDEINRLIAVVDPIGRRTEFEYHVGDLIASVRDPLGQVRTIEYDLQLNPIRVVDESGRESRSEYTSIEGETLVSKTLDPEGNETQFRYDQLGRLIEVLGPRGEKTLTRYDRAGRPVEVVETVSGGSSRISARFTYRGDGKLLSTSDEQGRVTRFGYDLAGRRIRVVDADDQATITLYDPYSRVIRTISPDGATTSFEYDALDRVVATTDHSGAVSRVRYDARGQVISTESPNGRVTRFEYDRVGRLTKVVSPDNQETVSEYDLAGQLIRVTDPDGRSTRFEYDALGRRTKVIGPLGEETVTAYNATGTVASIRDPKGEVTRFEYDGLDRLISATDEKDHSVLQRYDPSGNLVELVDRRDKSVRFTYDLAGQLIATTDDTGRAIRHEYNSSGERVATFNPLRRNGSQPAVTDPIRFEYDALGRVTRKLIPYAGEETFRYDRVGRRLLSKNPAVEETFEYDRLGRLTRKSDSRGFAVSFGYDPAGNQTSVTDGDGRRIGREFDELNRLSRLVGPRGRTWDFSYTPSGQLASRVRGDGQSTVFEYDDSGRLTFLEHRGPTEDPATPGSFLSSFSYQYDENGNRVLEIERRKSIGAIRTRYTYTNRNELRRAEVKTADGHLYKGFWKIEFNTDRAGNRTTTSIWKTPTSPVETVVYRRNRLNQLSVIDPTPDDRDDKENDLKFRYDFAGNLLEEPISVTLRRVNTWDNENNLVATRLEDSASGEVRIRDSWTYEYNADGLKIRAIREPDDDAPTRARVIHERFWVGGQAFEDRIYREGQREDREDQRRYVTAGFHVLSTLHDRRAGAEPGPRVDQFFLHDALGSTVVRQAAANVLTDPPGSSLDPISAVSPLAAGSAGGDQLRAHTSGDGAFIVFDSNAPDLVASDTNGHRDVFFTDVESSSTRILSLAPGGGPADGDSWGATVSADGRFVAFSSDATNLVSGDTNGFTDVFVCDTTLAETDPDRIRLISAPVGAQADGASDRPRISGGGGVVVFRSAATNLTAADTNGVADIYSVALATGLATRISQDAGGAQLDFPSDWPSVSDDGSVVAFESRGVLAEGQSQPPRDIFLYQGGAVVRISRGLGGAAANGSSSRPRVSGSGAVVVFTSAASNLVPGDTNASADGFTYESGTIQRVSVGSGASQLTAATAPGVSLSDSGRFVAFATAAPSADAGDGNGVSDVFVRDRARGVTVRLSRSSSGREGGEPSGDPEISADGRYVVFGTRAHSIVGGVDGGDARVARAPNTLSDIPADLVIDGSELVGRQGVARYFSYSPFGSITAITNQRGDRLDLNPDGSKRQPDQHLDFGFQGLRLELKAHNSSDFVSPHQMYSAMYRHARPHLGRWLKRDPRGFVEGPNRYWWLKNNPLRWMDPTGHSSFDPYDRERVRRRFATDTAGGRYAGEVADAANYGGLQGLLVGLPSGPYAVITSLGGAVRSVAFKVAGDVITGIRNALFGEPCPKEPESEVTALVQSVDAFLDPTSKFSSGVPLSNRQKKSLRGKGRRKWMKETGRTRAVMGNNQVHHRIPLEWSHVVGGDPNRLDNLVEVSPASHQLITSAWNAWRQSLRGRRPTAAEVLQQARNIDAQFGKHMRRP